jgi:hypothetical protein
MRVSAMSDKDSQEEAFLARWSRRKQEARAGEPAPQPDASIEPEQASPADMAEAPAKPDIDLSSLPPVDSIDATTDISAFLREGIPQELSRAALRQAWSVDPAIRDFVGLAENAWDFTDPTAMEGFGPLEYSAEQVDAFVQRIVGNIVQAAEGLAEATAEKSAGRKAAVERALNPADLAALPAPTEPQLGSAASQLATAVQRDGDGPPVRRRTHGGALPHEAATK